VSDAPTEVRREPVAWGPVARQVGLVVVLYAVVGAAAGWVWFRLWDPVTGIADDGKWYFRDSAGLRGEFPSTGWFVVVALVVGLVLGVLCAWLLDRSELATLLAVLAGAALATYLMWRVGLALSPADPHDVARTAADGDPIPSRIEVSGGSPFLVLPLASLAALTVAYVGFPKRPRARG
jgi:hypothetical protein